MNGEEDDDLDNYESEVAINIAPNGFAIGQQEPTAPEESHAVGKPGQSSIKPTSDQGASRQWNKERQDPKKMLGTNENEPYISIQRGS
ncbi:hypothetical protein R1flu_006233 [Riccia fluitans]|uniref:Uncharacterized protein n=1 Tax=Riccia fluitans TaxID=41844 RepID=A0ABD1YWG0_9MARC